MGTADAKPERIGPDEGLLYCDFCMQPETADARETGALRAMYRVDGETVCQRCLDAGAHVREGG